MFYRPITICILMLSFACAHAQLLPQEGAEVNYRLVGFSFPAREGCSYKLEIAGLWTKDTAAFRKAIISTHTSGENRIIAEVPAFGRMYAWRVGYVDKQGHIAYGDMHRFSTGFVENVDTNRTRLRILKPATEYVDAHVFIEPSRSLYDMQGNPVWFLPARGEFMDQNKEVRDLKLSPLGTITFLIDDKAYEVNYNGDILWRGPNDGRASGDSIEEYHHELTRLANGHRMIMGMEQMGWEVLPDSSGVRFFDLQHKPNGFSKTHIIPFGTVIEYDAQGNVVWVFKSSDYYAHDSLFCHRIPTLDWDGFSSHANAFYFDEARGYVYMSFKNTSQILKIKYPEGKVVNIYGDMQVPDHWDAKPRLYCQQHNVSISGQDYLDIFNNNSCGPDLSPQLLQTEQPKHGSKLKVVWQYDCTDNVHDDAPPLGWQITNGGSMTELPNHSFFAAMCFPYCNVFIVRRDKHKAWEAVLEKWEEGLQLWRHSKQYRASIITDHAMLEKLVWNVNK